MGELRGHHQPSKEIQKHMINSFAKRSSETLQDIKCLSQVQILRCPFSFSCVLLRQETFLFVIYRGNQLCVILKEPLIPFTSK